jgi:hypothetical protein
MDISSAALSSAEQPRALPNWLKLLQEWKALAWTIVAALMAALVHFLGYVAQGGERAALGIYALDKKSISPDYVMGGVTALATLGLQVIIVVIVWTMFWKFLKKIARLLPDKFQHSLHTIPQRKGWGWIVITAAVATSVLGRLLLQFLMRSTDAMVLKTADEVGVAWMSMSMDPTQGLHTLIQLLVTTSITTFIALSWWILTNFIKNTKWRTLYGLWMLTQVFSLVAGFAFLYGVSFTFGPYPIVTFSGEEQYGKHKLAALIGSDDKMFSFLVLFPGDKPNEVPSPSKVILYVPRTEIKWMTVLTQEPLYILAHYHDLKDSAPASPSNPAATGDSGHP